jgi:alkanesulfonate monooxygenase SsuD/methylene tetrahydromethanopterin reductase-like flavin-dependent oxidoreductase (luciferase family)
MFPGRSWVALGSGEALNEHVTGDPWPSKADRDRRLLESVEIIRALLRSDEVSHRGLVTIDRARIWSLPDHAPPIFGAAVSEQTAAAVGRWADGLITVHQPLERLRRVIDAFRDANGGSTPICVQVHVSWAETEAEALEVEGAEERKHATTAMRATAAGMRSTGSGKPIVRCPSARWSSRTCAQRPTSSGPGHGRTVD